MISKKFHKRLPEWLKKKSCASDIHNIKTDLRSHALHTVCEEAKCPNIGECFSRGTATIMIMGDVCTRNCGFCAVKSGTPKPLDRDEPERVAEQIKKFGLRHAVITSVTRDDLKDGGATHFAQTITKIRELCENTTIEVLTPDFSGNEGDLKTVCVSGPHIFNHNIETVKRLTPQVRDRAVYETSLRVLSTAKKYLVNGFIKSGFMLGLGETEDEIDKTLLDLQKSGADIITIGQYLKPSRDSLDVAEYVNPVKFQEYKELGLKYGFRYVFSGPLVRSSYLADMPVSMGGAIPARS